MLDVGYSRLPVPRSHAPLYQRAARQLQEAWVPCTVAAAFLIEHKLVLMKKIPDKGVQMVRCYGWYSNKMRGLRQRGLPPHTVVRRPGVSPPPPVRLPSKRWRDLTRLAVALAEADPARLELLCCPVCGNPMRVIAVIDDVRVVEKILRHLGAWHDPPA